MPGTDVLVINEVEAGNAFGVNLRKADDTVDTKLLSEVGEKFFALGLRQELVIHYPEGAYARLADGTECRINSYVPPKVVGSVGAGDAFCAGVLYSIMKGFDAEHALRLGSCAAAMNLAAPDSVSGARSYAETFALDSEFTRR